MCSFSHARMAGLGLAPVRRATSIPLLNKIIVGIDLTSCLNAIIEFSSVFNFAVIKADSYSELISSKIGASTRQGLHHSAQKSTSTGRSLSSTTESKSLVVTSINSCLPLIRLCLILVGLSCGDKNLLGGLTNPDLIVRND